MVRVARRWFVVAATLVLATGCLSPTLPLPPPSPDVGSPNSQGLVEISGYTDGGGIEIYAENLRSRDINGQISADDGRYDFFLPAQVGDQVVVYYIIGNDRSQPYSKVIK